MGTTRETFFLPDEVGREASSITAEIYNLAHTLLSRSETDCVFVPIRRMQFLGVITETEVVFVDSLAYEYKQNEGGRVIMLAWQFKNTHDRKSLEEPVDCDVVFYRPESRDIQLRLIRDFSDAMHQLDDRYREETLPADGAKIIKLK